MRLASVDSGARQPNIRVTFDAICQAVHHTPTYARDTAACHKGKFFEILWQACQLQGWVMV